MSSQSISEGTFFQAKRLLISHCLSLSSVFGTASLYVVSSKIIQMLSREVTSRDFAGRSSFAIKFPNPSGTQGRAPVKMPLIAWQVEKKCTAVQNIEIILATMNSLSLLFCRSSLNTVSNAVYLSNLKCAYYLHSFPIPFSYFRLFASNSR